MPESRDSDSDSAVHRTSGRLRLSKSSNSDEQILLCSDGAFKATGKTGVKGFEHENTLCTVS